MFSCELIEEEWVDVHDNNDNILFVNSGFLGDGFVARIEHLVRPGNYKKGEEDTGNEFLDCYGAIEFG